MRTCSGCAFYNEYDGWCDDLEENTGGTAVCEEYN